MLFQHIGLTSIMDRYNLFSTGNTAGQFTGQFSAGDMRWVIVALFVIDSFLDV